MTRRAIPIRLAHSPDSDDLVMWWPLVGLDGQHPALDTRGFTFQLRGRDVEELNKMAADSAYDQYDATAISCAAYPKLHDRYVITRCGGSFGEGYGPRIVARSTGPVRIMDDLRGKRVAVPGLNTSAFLTLSILLGATGNAPAIEPVEMLFSEIPDAVANGRVDAGLLIHEAQLTFEQAGLVEIGNLGLLWAEQTDLPLPLGLNVVRRDLDERFGTGTVARLGRVLSDSVRYAVDHPAECRQHLQANKGDRTEWDDPDLVDRYLAMYVSGLTMDMGDRGKRAIEYLLGRGAEAGLCANPGPIDLV